MANYNLNYTGAQVDAAIANMMGVDDTLTQAGKPADAKAAGDQIGYLFDVTAKKSSNNINMLLDEYKTVGYYRHYNTGVVSEHEDYILYDMIPADPNAKYYVGISDNVHICYLDEEGVYISGTLTNSIVWNNPATFADKITIVTPAATKYISISHNPDYPGTRLYPDGAALYDSTRNIQTISTDDISVFKYENIINPPDGIVKVCNENLLDLLSGYTGHYINASGELVGNVGYMAVILSVKPGTNYTTTGFYNNHNAFYTASGQLISGSVIPADATITTPSTAKYWGVSIFLANTDFAICEGDVAEYSVFGTGSVYRTASIVSTILTVGVGRDYATIAEAVSSANDNDIILVTDGTYHEAVDCTSKSITIVGASKNGCILEYENGDYFAPPLEMAKGVLKNMTVHAITQELQEGGLSGAYCLHTDHAGSTDSSLYVENVKFINDDKQPAGIGLQGGFTLEFANCEFVCSGNNNAFYCHDDATEPASPQALIVRNCTFINNGSANTIRMQSQEISGAVAHCTWQRNIVVNIGTPANLLEMVLWADPPLAKDAWLGSTDWNLTPESALNTLATLNAF